MRAGRGGGTVVSLFSTVGPRHPRIVDEDSGRETTRQLFRHHFPTHILDTERCLYICFGRILGDGRMFCFCSINIFVYI